MRYVTAETMKPMNHLRTINPEVREGVSRFLYTFRFIVTFSGYSILFNHGAQYSSRTQLFSLVI